MSRASGEPALIRRLFAGGLWASFGRIVALGASFLLSTVVARILDPTDVGVYFLASSVVLVVSLVARLGLERTAARAVTAGLANRQPERTRSAVIASLRITMIAAVTVGAAFAWKLADLIGRLAFDTNGFGPIAGWLGAWLAFVALQGLVAELFRGFHDIRGATIFGGPVSALATLALLAGLVVAGMSMTLRGTVIATVIATAGSVVVGTFLVLRRALALPSGGARYSVGELLSDSVHVVIGSMAVQVVLWSGMWIVGALASERDVAIFGAATRLVFLLNTPLNIVNQVLPPTITEMDERGQHGALERVLRASAALATIPAAALVVLFVVAGGPVMSLLFGRIYGEAGPVLAVLAVGQLTNVWVGSCGMTLLMTGGHRAWMVISVLAAAGSLIACYFAGKVFGTLGIAWAMATVTAVQQIATLVAARRKCGVWTHASIRVLWKEARRLIAQRKAATTGL